MIQLDSFSPVRQGRQLYDLKNIDCLPGSITVIMGKSGVGKTSILESIRGDCDHSGTIKVTGKIFSIWQHENQMFPWFTIRKNLDIACAQPYKKLCDQWNLSDLLDRKPLQVSGGQQQRFLLIMAMCSGRDNLLCDEALSSVDRPTARQIAQDFRSAIKDKNQSIIWVTHDQQEAEILADNIVYL